MKEKLNLFGLYDSECQINNNFDIDKIYYEFGIRILNSKIKSSIFENMEYKKSLCELISTNNIEGIKAIGKDVYKKCVGIDKLIPQEYWDDIEKFNHPSLECLYHPHFRLAFEKLKEIYKPNSDVLVLCSCGGSKPYSNNQNYSVLLKASKAGYFDLCILSIYPVFLHPLDISVAYPYCFYDWPHNESKKLEEIKDENKTHYLIEFLLKHSYKKIIFIHSGKLQNVISKLKEYNLNNIEIIDILDDKEFVNDMEMMFKNVWRSRIFRSNQIRIFLKKELHLENDPRIEEIFAYSPTGLKNKMKRENANQKINTLEFI
jgi:hypothetical protein